MVVVMVDNGMKEYGVMFLVLGEFWVLKDISYEMGIIDSVGDDELWKEWCLMWLWNECLLVYMMIRFGGYLLLEGLGVVRM